MGGEDPSTPYPQPKTTHAPRLALLSARMADLYARMIATIRNGEPFLGLAAGYQERGSCQRRSAEETGTSLQVSPESRELVARAYGLSHDPLFAERNRASMTRMFRIASSIGNSSGVALMIAREKASPCSVY